MPPVVQLIRYLALLVSNMSKQTKKRKESVKEAHYTLGSFIINNRALIAGFLNLILVGLGYAYLKQYKKAIIAFVAYIILYLFIFVMATSYPILIWLGLPITLFFVYDAYKTGEKLS